VIRPVLVTPPAEPPVTLDEAKAHLRVDHDDDDDLISGFVAAAVSYLDGHTGVLGRCMVTQTWRQGLSAWPPSGQILLPYPDVDPDTVEVTFRDSDDAEQTLPDGQFEVIEDIRGAVVSFRRSFTSPAVSDDRQAPVSVTFAAGFGAAADVPVALKAAVLLLVGDLYENREDTVVGQVQVAELPLSASRLIAPWRRGI
jgi:uncharacterized phiE125 gp8 family phage protein